MEEAMEKGTQSYLRLVFGTGRMQIGASRMQICLGKT